MKTRLTLVSFAILATALATSCLDRGRPHTPEFDALRTPDYDGDGSGLDGGGQLEVDFLEEEAGEVCAECRTGNAVPVADAGDDLLVKPGAIVELDGSNSHDDDDPDLSFEWTQTGGTEVDLDNPNAERPKFVAPMATTELVFRLTVTDLLAVSEPDEIVVSVVNTQPIADAGDDQEVAGGKKVVLDGTGSTDGDGHKLTFLWQQGKGPKVELSDSGSSTPTFTATEKKATLIFTLTVSDGIDDSELATVTVTVANNVPEADAGADQKVDGGTVVQLAGEDSSDIDNDKLSFLWSQDSGPAVELDDPTAATPTFVAPVPKSTLVFSLVVNDGEDDSAPDNVIITTSNNAPVADAGPDQQASGGEAVELDGTGSQDIDEDELSYDWTQVPGPGEPKVILTNAKTATPSFTALPGKSVVTLSLVVNDGEAVSEPDEVLVHIDNQPPVAFAGEDKVAELGELVQLNGGGSFDEDGDALSYQWTQIGGEPLELFDADTAAPTFGSPFKKDELVFELVVHDGLASSEPDQIAIHVGNLPPIAVVGEDLVVQKGEEGTLDGSNSYDPDDDELSYTWTQVEGLPAELAGADTAEPGFVAPGDKTKLVFELLVADGLAQSEPAYATVHVGNIPPIADAGEDQLNVAHNTVVQLGAGGSSDFDGDQLNYSWMQVEGDEVQLSNPHVEAPTFLAPATKSSLEFQLIVNDGLVDSEPDTVLITTENSVPVADAGEDLILEGGEAVQLDGSNSQDADGDPLTYNWTQTDGAPVLLDGADTPTPSFEAPKGETTLVFELVVSDGSAQSQPDQVSATIENHAPVSDAGSSQSVVGGSKVTLLGSGSFDLDDDELTYSWTQISGPPVELSDPATMEPTFLAPIERSDLQFQLIVSDGALSSQPALVAVSIKNNTPVAVATDMMEAVSGTLVELDGSGSYDLDDDELSFLWAQTSGPDVTLFDSSGAVASFYAPGAKGELTFSLAVFDGFGWSEEALVAVKVANNPPVADAGPDQNVMSMEVVTLDGQGSSDADSDELDYSWSQVGGPDVVLVGAMTAQPQFTAPEFKSSLAFQLVVNDGDVASAPDTAQVNVGNNPPTADPGSDMNAESGATVMLDGSGSSDVDNDQIEFLWEQTAGEVVVLDDPTSATPEFVAPLQKGTLTFSLKTFDGTAWSEPVFVSVFVANNQPVAVAGDPQTVAGGSQVMLDGTGSLDIDNDDLTYFWFQIEGDPVALDDPALAKPTFKAPVPKGQLKFRLTVNDGLAESAPAFVIITVQNNAPVADGGQDQSVPGESFVTLSGAGSDDVDNDVLTYQWTQTAGENVVLTDASAAKPTFQAPLKKQELTFELVVNDGGLDSAPDSVAIAIQNNFPVADAGDYQLVAGNSLVQLDGSASFDVDGDELSFVWTQVSGSSILLSGADAEGPTFIAPQAKSDIVLSLVVGDGASSSAPASVTVAVMNNPPVAKAGADQNVTGSSIVTLDGSASFDIDGDELTFAWQQIDGPEVVLVDASAAKPTFEAPEFKSALTFELVVSDGEAGSYSDQVVVSVANNAPIADAGTEQTVDAGELTTLDGSGSFDIDGDPIEFQWSQLGGQNVLLSDPKAPSPTFQAPDQKDTLLFQLLVSDGTTWSESSVVAVNVANNPPTANAGPDQSVDGGVVVVLDGSGSSDPDDDPLLYQWTQVDGTPVPLSNPSSPAPSFTAPIPAQTMTFVLVVSDGSVESVPDIVAVVIKNHAPTAVAGSDQVVEGGAQVQLDGSGSFDLDNDLLNVEWVQTGGTEVALSDAASASPTFTAPVPKGTLTFKLVVNDGQIDGAPDFVHVTISNHVPSANAGADQGDIIGGSQVSLDGSASTDLDGDELTYEWAQLTGPAVQLSSSTAASPTFTAPIAKSALSFSLVVNDGEIDSAPDTVTISVANQAPVADAGSDIDADKEAIVQLDGSGSSDFNGDDLTYLWTQTAGPAVALDDETAETPGFTAPNEVVQFEFELVVNDGIVDSPPDTIIVRIGDLPPEAHAGPDKEYDPGALVTLDGSGSKDPNNDPLTLSWVQLSGDPVDLSDPSAEKPTFTAPIPRQQLEFQLTVTAQDKSDSDTVIISTKNNKPVAEAGEFADKVPGQSLVTLDGTASYDVDGDDLTYQWTQKGGEGVTLSDKNAAKPTFTAPLKKQELKFELKVNDGFDNSDPDLVFIYVANNAPTANAGPNKTREQGEGLCLDGSDSFDIDGDGISYLWTQISGQTVSLDDPTKDKPCFNTWKIGKYHFSLVVTDDDPDNPLSSSPDVVVATIQED